MMAFVVENKLDSLLCVFFYEIRVEIWIKMNSANAFND
jgi:hypothetical protein